MAIISFAYHAGKPGQKVGPGIVSGKFGSDEIGKSKVQFVGCGPDQVRIGGSQCGKLHWNLDFIVVFVEVGSEANKQNGFVVFGVHILRFGMHKHS